MVITALRPQQGSKKEGKGFLPFSSTHQPLSALSPTIAFSPFRSLCSPPPLSFLSPYFICEKNPFQKLPKDLPDYFSLTRTNLYAHLQTNH